MGKVIKLGSDPSLREQMSRQSRRMAEKATWESIGNRVAWKLAEALETKSIIAAAAPRPGFNIPIYSWLLLSSGPRQFLQFLLSLVVDARLLAGLGVIVGVWGGLIATWMAVQAGLLIRRRAPWLSRAPGGTAN